MMTNEIRAITDEDFDVTISVEGGEELAQRTFNSKVGVVGGISIIGTSGIVHPLSNEAFIQSMRREIEVAKAIGCQHLAFVSGKKAEEQLRQSKAPLLPKGAAIQDNGNGANDSLTLPFERESNNSSFLIPNSSLKPHSSLRYIHYGNAIGEALKAAYEIGFRKVTLGIMIGKAVKLAEGNLDTHSHKVTMNKDFLKSLAGDDADKINGITLARELWDIMPQSFFDKIRNECYKHCRSVFPEGELDIMLIKDK